MLIGQTFKREYNHPKTWAVFACLCEPDRSSESFLIRFWRPFLAFKNPLQREFTLPCLQRSCHDQLSILLRTFNQPPDILFVPQASATCRIGQDSCEWPITDIEKCLVLSLLVVIGAPRILYESIDRLWRGFEEPALLGDWDPAFGRNLLLVFGFRSDFFFCFSG